MAVCPHRITNNRPPVSVLNAEIQYYPTMKKIGIYYGSTTGTTEELAYKIAKSLGVTEADVHNVAKSSPSSVADYDVLLLGTSTWGSGELQDDWYDFAAGLSELDLSSTKIALFGCGDETMADTFCSGVGELYKRLKDTGATFIGEFNTDGYNFSHSDAVIDGKAVGLLIDQVNHSGLTDARVADWTRQLSAAM